MAENVSPVAFADAFVPEDEAVEQAVEAALRLGCEPVSSATGMALALASAGGAVSSMVEIGTGTGVSGLWLLKGAPGAQLTHRLAERLGRGHLRGRSATGVAEPSRVVEAADPQPADGREGVGVAAGLEHDDAGHLRHPLDQGVVRGGGRVVVAPHEEIGHAERPDAGAA